MKRYLKDGGGVLKSDSLTRCAWSDAEDQKLAELAKLYKGKRWDTVAEGVSGLAGATKTAKQCRERWHNHLNPTMIAHPWSPDEEDQLFELHRKVGNRWSDLARMMKGRTDNSIKNYFFCKLRKIARCLKYGVVSLEMDRLDVKLEHTLYLLDYLHKFYISPDRKENLKKIITSQIKGRKNAGDRYICSLIKEECITLEKYDKFLRELMATLRPSQLQTALQLFPHFSVFSPCDTDDTFSKLQQLQHERRASCVSLRSSTSDSKSVPSSSSSLPLSFPGKKTRHTFINNTTSSRSTDRDHNSLQDAAPSRHLLQPPEAG